MYSLLLDTLEGVLFAFSFTEGMLGASFVPSEDEDEDAVVVGVEGGEDRLELGLTIGV